MMAAIAVLSLMPVPEVKQIDVPLMDKWVHMLMYAALSATFWIGHLLTHSRPVAMHLLVGGLLLPVAWGGLMELGQAYLTTCRTGDWLDFVANTIGALLANAIGLALLAAWRRAKTM